jgi:hypothetical protein
MSQQPDIPKSHPDEVAPQQISELPLDYSYPISQDEFQIRAPEKGKFEISMPDISLEIGGDPLVFSVTLQKEVTSLKPEEPVGDELPALQDMLTAAKALRAIPEQERPRQIMELLRSRVQYAHQGAIKKIEESDQQLATEVRDFNGFPPLLQLSTLRRAVQLGYGICGPLSVGMLVLGKEAGLEGAFLGNSPRAGKASGDDPNPIKNVIRLDNNQPLFKGDKNYGHSIPVAHSWVEFKLSDGTWMPVDPSAELVGDTEKGLQTFKAANYRASVGSTLKISALPDGAQFAGTRDLEFLPGEDLHTGMLAITPVANNYKGQIDITLNAYKPPIGIPLGVGYEIVDVSQHEARVVT